MSELKLEDIEPIKVKSTKSLFRHNCESSFKFELESVAFTLSQSLLEGDFEAFHEIIAGYLAVVNKEELSRRSEIPIATIRRLAAGKSIKTHNLLKIMSAIREHSKAV
jgi:hypothetical protein